MDNDLFVRLLPEKQANRRNLEAVLYCGLCVCICVCACVRVCVRVCVSVLCVCGEEACRLCAGEMLILFSLPLYC